MSPKRSIHDETQRHLIDEVTCPDVRLLQRTWVPPSLCCTTQWVYRHLRSGVPGIKPETAKRNNYPLGIRNHVVNCGHELCLGDQKPSPDAPGAPSVQCVLCLPISFPHRPAARQTVGRASSARFLSLLPPFSCSVSG